MDGLANYTSVALLLTPTGLPRLFQEYNHFMETNSDPRTRDWWLLGSVSPLVTILVAYYYFCTKLGPRLMRDRKPFDIKVSLLIYNLANVGISLWIVSEGLQAGWWNDYSLRCQPVDYSDNPKALRMARAVWIYFVVKLVELLDTVFFVLRKKNQQVTHLHLYHHTIMPVCGWIGAKFLPGGHGTLLGLINSLIHVIMYSYYLLAALGPQYNKYLWWKSYLTSLQMLQFVLIFLHQAQLLVFECDYPKTIVLLLAGNALYFFYLFGAFYVRTYLRRSGAPGGKKAH